MLGHHHAGSAGRRVPAGRGGAHQEEAGADHSLMLLHHRRARRRACVAETFLKSANSYSQVWVIHMLCNFVIQPEPGHRRRMCQPCRVLHACNSPSSQPGSSCSSCTRWLEPSKIFGFACSYADGSSPSPLSEAPKH